MGLNSGLQLPAPDSVKVSPKVKSTDLKLPVSVLGNLGNLLCRYAAETRTRIMHPPVWAKESRPLDPLHVRQLCQEKERPFFGCTRLQ